MFKARDRKRKTMDAEWQLGLNFYSQMVVGGVKNRGRGNRGARGMNGTVTEIKRIFGGQNKAS